jgi:Arm domain-containing DNA-binding protein
MTRLNDTALKAELKKAREAQEEIVDSAVPGLAVRVGRGLAATWSLVLRVRGEGGVSRRGFEKKGRRYRLSLGTYPAMSLEAARARANEFIAQANAGESPMIALERAAAGGLTVEALAERFIEDYARSKNLKSVRKYEQAIATHILPQLGEVSVAARTAASKPHAGRWACSGSWWDGRSKSGSSTARIIRRAEWRGTYPEAKGRSGALNR